MQITKPLLFNQMLRDYSEIFDWDLDGRYQSSSCLENKNLNTKMWQNWLRSWENSD